MIAIRNRIWATLEGTRLDDPWARAWGIFISTLIALNVLAVMCETAAPLKAESPAFFYWFELGSVAVFTVEYLLRLYSARSDARYSRPVAGRLRFALTGLSIVDLVSILPFYLPFFGVDMRFVRVLRLFRVIRLAKLGRYNSGMQLLYAVLREKKEELIISSAIMVILIVFSASAIYYCEHDAQPEAFSSIPASLWWAVATLTTVGYGDVYPVTIAGKFFAATLALLGIGMVALPTGMLGAGFVEQIEKRKQSGARCPHCGEALNAPNRPSRENS